MKRFTPLTFSRRLTGLTLADVYSGGINIAARKTAVGLELKRSIDTIAGSTTVIQTANYTFSNLDKNARYAFILYEGGKAEAPFWRRCFKTRGEFSNAQNSRLDRQMDRSLYDSWQNFPCWMQIKYALYRGPAISTTAGCFNDEYIASLQIDRIASC